MATPHILSVAARSIGIPALKPEQEKVIRDLLDGRDVLFVCPLAMGSPRVMAACLLFLIAFDELLMVPQ